MNITNFYVLFDKSFPAGNISKPTFIYGNRLTRFFFDPCRNVRGMVSIKKQKLLNIAFACLDVNECYLEVGTYLGKSLISAMLGNPPRHVFACDNFSEFTKSNSHEGLKQNLKAYNLLEKVTFFDADFTTVLTKERISPPVGVYFYDGAHDEASQYLAIKLVEPLLSNEALVIIDDWRFAPDSGSYAKVATERAVAESANEWQMLYELPARYNGDRAMWWNGVAIYAFKRQA
jgi:predicted O-methyltransferase YrrM